MTDAITRWLRERLLGPAGMCCFAGRLRAGGLRGVGRGVIGTTLAGIFAILVTVSHAQTFVAPGDVGTIEYPLQNSSISDAALQDATLEYDAPAHFIVKAASIRGPHSLPPAETFSFIVEYEIAPGAPEGPFEITLKPRSPSSSDEEVEVAPPLASLDTSVNLDIGTTLFLVGGRQSTFFERAGKTRENLGLPEFYHREPNRGVEDRNVA